MDIRLSQRTPSLQHAHILCVAGSTEGLKTPHTQILPLELHNGNACLRLSEDVSEEADIGGRDNVFDTVDIVLQVKNGAHLSVTLGDFRIAVNKFFEAAHAEQKSSQLKWENNTVLRRLFLLGYLMRESIKTVFLPMFPRLTMKKRIFTFPTWMRFGMLRRTAAFSP